MAKAAKEEVRPGDVLGGKYRIERVIGHGGMGVVAAARHAELHQRVAIKVLPAHLSGDKDLVERFMREARAAAKLRSEHAVKVVDVGARSNGSPYIVMELLEGEDLGAVVERGPLPIPVAVDYVLQACEAVAEAHALGIVHRDLKPRNLFLTAKLHGKALVKVLDFGLAKRINMQDRALTATAAVMGSPQYMSPEQMRGGRGVDFRTDVWSLGVCLYELLSARVPFDAGTVPVLCAMVLKDDPVPLPRVRPDVPPALWAVVQRCLAKDPALRVATVSDLAAALEPFAPSHARGAALRIAAVLNSASTGGSDPPEAMDGPDRDGETRSAATYESRSGPRPGVHASWWLVGAVSILVSIGLAVVGGVLIMQALRRTPSRRAPATYEPDVAALGEPTPRPKAATTASEPTLAAPVRHAPATGEKAGEKAAESRPRENGDENPNAKF
ncbi:MAG: Serine/threonine-protein kinase pkn3 [Labilithrix sp.]|nr:Serine/threonine-protein kinase pkn3 [Labilithrix sp.]